MAVSYRALPAEVLEEFDKASANYRWIQDNLETLREKYPDEFIAVVDCELVYHTKTYRNLLKYLYVNRGRLGLVASQTHSADRILLR